MPRGQSPRVKADARLKKQVAQAKRLIDGPMRPEPRGTTTTRASRISKKLSKTLNTMRSEQDRVDRTRTKNVGKTGPQLKGSRPTKSVGVAVKSLFKAPAGYSAGTKGRRRSTNVVDRRGKDHR